MLPFSNKTTLGKCIKIIGIIKSTKSNDSFILFHFVFVYIFKIYKRFRYNVFYVLLYF